MDVIEQRAHKLIATGKIRIAQACKAQVNGHSAFRLESFVHAHQADKTAEEQSRRDKTHCAERHQGADQPAARISAAPSSGNSLASRFERALRIRARQPPRGQYPEENDARHRRQRGEVESVQVHASLLQPRQIDRSKPNSDGE